MLSWARKPAETRCSCTPEAFIPAGDPDIIEEDGNAEVDDVCVIGVPHDMLGELMGACIVPVPSLVRVADVFPLTGNRRRKRRARERARALDHTAITGST